MNQWNWQRKNLPAENKSAYSSSELQEIMIAMSYDCMLVYVLQVACVDHTTSGSSQW